MQRYTVNQLAKLSGVSIRTLHYYDEIGLLSPAFLGDNRYRYYQEQQLLSLQQILFYREFGVSLSQIATLLVQKDEDLISSLLEHRQHLESQVQRYQTLMTTIDQTIVDLKGKRKMKHADLYKGFSPEKQAHYEQELIAKFDAEGQQHVRAAVEHYAKSSVADIDEKMQELAAIEQEIASYMKSGIAADSDLLDTVMTRHRRWVERMWNRPCPLPQYLGLAEMYLHHPDFQSRYDQIEAGLSTYLPAAIQAYAKRTSEK